MWRLSKRIYLADIFFFLRDFLSKGFLDFSYFGILKKKKNYCGKDWKYDCRNR